jgi:aminopeptidase YwaD
MDRQQLENQAQNYLHKLCLEIPNRCVGSQGNRTATDFFAETVRGLGFQVEMPEFECIDWEQRGTDLSVGNDRFEAYASPYSLGCQVEGALSVISTISELEIADLTRKIVLLRGEIAKEQLMPKNFTFYNPEEHQRIIRLLEDKNPLAIISATSRDPQMAGAVYPFPLIEDGDFDIPSVFMTEEEGDKLAAYTGRATSLTIRAARHPARGCNVIARKNADRQTRVVLFAHIDAKLGTPGALDNASGIVVLLLLAQLLKSFESKFSVEIVALNGEDYYAASGEQLYVSQNQDKFADISLGINLDGVGYYHGNTAYSLYDCPKELANIIHCTFSSYMDIVAGEPWYQGDHGLFIMNHTPALAITSEFFNEILIEVAHTPKDTPNLIVTTKLVDMATALRDLLIAMDQPVN